MCEVCAIFGVSPHWTDAAPIGVADDPALAIRGHRIERRRRIDILNGWLSRRDVSVRDWDGEAFVVEAADGRMHVVPDLSALWPAIEAMAGAPFDPLEPGGWVGAR